MHHVIRAALALLLLVACEGRESAPSGGADTPPGADTLTGDADAPLRTDRDRYVLRPGDIGPEAVIVATFTNPTDAPLYIVNCNGAIGWGLQRLVGEWVEDWIVAMNACLSEPLVVAAGGSRTDTLYFRPDGGGSPPSGVSRDPVEEGTYRVVLYGVLTSFDPDARPMGKEVPVEQRVSQPFTIEPGG